MPLRTLAIIILVSACPAAYAQQEQCDPAAFREAVAQASARITGLQKKNAPVFQAHLQKLRTQNNWREAEYVANAAPFVRDETTTALDAANQALLAKVQSLDAARATTGKGRCAMLAELKFAMEKVVSNTAAKWEHMLGKVNSAVAHPIQAGFTR
jgi:hypothetical protein